jgi:hypothetical protein
MGPEWLRAARSKAVARAHGGGGLANREGGGAWATRCGAANRWGHAATGPGVSGGVGRKRSKRGSTTVGHR